MSTKKYFSLFLVLFCLISIYFSSCSYSAQINYEELLANAPGVNIQNDGSTLVVSSDDAENAIIFYPGGFVNYEAYLPLMVEIAKKNIKCFLVQMPSDLAIFYINAADRYFVNYPEVKNWYIGGHSLGGAMAAKYISENSSKCKGLILLAAYSTEDLTGSGLKVLSLYGSNDGVLNKENYNKYLSNLPSDATEHIIQGGNHSQFASYGFQKGDGTAEISAQEQWQEAASYIEELCKAD